MVEPATDALGVGVHHLSVEICVIAVDGELDLLTAPLLDSVLRVQLALRPPHLIVDLHQLCFLGCAGLRSLFHARELGIAGGSALHLSGLSNRTVSRALDIGNLSPLFDTHPTLAHALGALAGSPVPPSF